MSLFSSLGRSSAAAAAAAVLLLLCSLPALAQGAAPSPPRGEDRIVLGGAQASARVSLQRTLSERIRSLLTPGSGGVLLMVAAAAGYGVLHALGPGHQKTLLGGYFLSEGGGLGTIAAAAATTAALHAAAVLVLFGGAALVLGALPMAAAERGRIWVTRISGLVLLALALRLLALRIRDAAVRLRGLGHAEESGAAGGHHHHHGGEDGHECAACARMEVMRKGGAPRWSILLAGGLAPCPGAALFMLYGMSSGNSAAGVLAVLAISAGMAVTLFLVSWAAASLRALSLKASARSYPVQVFARSILEVGGSLLMVFFASLLIF